MKPKKCKRRTNKYTKRRQKHIGGYTSKNIFQGIGNRIKSAKRTFEDARIGYRNAIATYELKKLYDTEQGQYVFEQLGRINFERNPKGVLRELINQVLPANGLIFDNYEDKIKDVTQAYEKINLDGLKDLKSNHNVLLDFFEKFLLLLKDDKYISDISKHRNMSKGQNKSKKRNSMFNGENVTNSTL